MRHGLPPGVTADTQLLLRFEHGQRSDDGTTFDDLSGNDISATIVGRPTFGAGPHGAGASFASASHHLYTADAASINISGDIAIESTLRLDALGSISTALDRTDTDNAWRIGVTAAGALEFTIWNSAGSSETLTTNETIVAGRTYWVRCGVQFGGTDYMTIEVEGELWQRRVTNLSDIDAAGLGVLTIGQRANGTEPFVGTLGNIRIQDVADTSADTASPNIQPERITHRLYQRADIDLGEELSGASWTTSGSNYWIAWSSLTLGGFILDWRDVIAVKATTTAGATETTFSEVGEEADLSSDDYLVDVVNERVYSSEDPSGYIAFIVVVRYRGADKRLRVGSRSYRATLVTASGGERSTPYIFQPFPTGAGTTMALSTQHADHPAAFGFEETGNVLWRGGAVTLRAQSDHMPASEAAALSTGVLEGPPKVDPDLMRLRAYGEQSRLHNLTIEGSILTLEDYPDAREDDIGYEFPAIWGVRHREVPCVMIEKTAVAKTPGQSWYRFKVCAHKIARISNVYNVSLSVQRDITEVDLTDGTFWAFTNQDSILVCDVDGYGTPSTPTSSVGEFPLEFGDAADAIAEPVDQLKEQLTVYAAVPAADMTDASWANTDGRVKIRRRFAEPLPAKGALVGELQRALPEMLAFLFWKAAGDLGLRDVRKADSVDATLYDYDVISYEWPTDTTLLAKRAEASAYTYRGTTQGQIKKGAATLLTLKADAKYDVHEVFYPPPSSSGKDLTRIAYKGSLDTWLAIVRKFAEEPSRFYRATVSAEFASRELMDVIDLQVSSRPSAVGSRFRVMRIKPMADGTVEIECFAEDLFPADGTSAPAVRAAFGPQRHLDYGVAAGQNIPNAGGWNRIGDHASIYQGGFPFPSSITQRFVIRAQRSGGASDSDLQIRIRDIDNSLTLATISGVGTSAGFGNTATFANIPSGDARLELQAQTTNGASGTIWAATWGSEEIAASVGDPVPPTTLWQLGSAASWSCPQAGRAGYRPIVHLRTGDASGLTLANSAAWAVVNDHQCIYVGALKQFTATMVHRFTVRAQRIGGTDVEFRIRDITNGQTIGTITGVGTSAAFTGGTFTPANVPAGNARLELQYRTTGGASATFWAGVWETDEGRPAAGTTMVGTTFWETGSNAGQSTTRSIGPSDAGSYYTFPGMRPGIVSGRSLGALDHMVDWIAAGYTLRATIYVDPGSSTTFHPVIIRRRWNLGGLPGGTFETKELLCDFGVVTSAGFYTYDITAWPSGAGSLNFEVLTYEYFKNTSDSNSVTTYAVSLDLVPPDHAWATQAWNVPGARAGHIDWIPLPIGTVIRAALRHSSGSSTNFQPRLLREDGTIVADFGAVSSASGILTTEFIAVTESTLRLGYSLDSGGPSTIESLSLDAVYPELED